jgi:hypothetical protein
MRFLYWQGREAHAQGWRFLSIVPGGCHDSEFVTQDAANATSLVDSIAMAFELYGYGVK